MLPTTSKQLVEERYGRAITDDEYLVALEYAKMKLEFQAKLFNKTFDVAYLTIVVAEEVNQARLDKMYAERIAILKAAQAEQDDQGIESGVRDGNLERRSESNLVSASHYPYYSTVPVAMQ